MTHSLKQVRDYTRTHFSAEEKLMRDLDYAGYPRHKEMHDGFVERVGQLDRLVADGRHDEAGSVAEAMIAWFTRHILVEDPKYSALYRHRTAAGQ